MRKVDSGIAFEGKRLFAFGTITDLGSREEAEVILAAGVSLTVEGQEVFIRSGERTVHRCCWRSDDFGRWFPGANRESLDDYLERFAHELTGAT